VGANSLHGIVVRSLEAIGFPTHPSQFSGGSAVNCIRASRSDHVHEIPV